jgi:hypothetical protein
MNHRAFLQSVPLLVSAPLMSTVANGDDRHRRLGEGVCRGGFRRAIGKKFIRHVWRFSIWSRYTGKERDSESGNN